MKFNICKSKGHENFEAFLFWSRGPDGYRKNDRKRAVVWSWLVLHYIMAGRAIVVVKDINLLFYHGNAVTLTPW